mmetsp:Transcript_68097/g.163432  ORF Transcript_68097/g.163432 Transcript_68097/m.163432 type:complete len:304 (+) Transcript_68097:149-1060(+)
MEDLSRSANDASREGSAASTPIGRKLAQGAASQQESSGYDPTVLARGGRSRRAQADDSWAGVSLGDALGPKKSEQHRYGKPEEPGPKLGKSAAAVSSSPARGWEGASLGDVLTAPAAAQDKAPNDGAKQSGSFPPTGGSYGEEQKAPVPQQKVSARQAANDPWAGASLGDALQSAPAKVSVPSGPPPAPAKTHGKAAQGRGSSAASCDKGAADIVVWLRSLPDSHVPEKAKEDLANVVQEQHMTGDDFTSFVQKVPPELCGPKHAMKLKAAWNNVLAEAEAKEVCKQNLEIAAKAPKAVQLVC